MYLVKVYRAASESSRVLVHRTGDERYAKNLNVVRERDLCAESLYCGEHSGMGKARLAKT